VIEASGDVGSILQLYESKGFDFSDLMIRQAARRSDADILVTFHQKAAQLDGVELPGGDWQQ
jgi:predicted nucleic-acid-binding protein